MDKNELDEVKIAIADVFSDFYNDVIKKDMDNRFNDVNHEIRDLRLTTEALVKIVDYAKLEARMKEFEDRLKTVENKLS
ncbi:MAG: hypothetical protein AAF363_08820 [Bacteroidota bacterium]